MPASDADPPDHAFALLGLVPTYAIDETDLESAFIRRSSEVHPDRFTDPLEQAEAAERYAALSDAFHTLSDPLGRAEVLLSILTGGGEHGRKASEGGGESPLPPDLLMEVMEVREAVEEAARSGDEQALAAHRKWAEDRLAHHLDRLTGLFDEHLNSGTMNAEPDTLGPAVRRELNAARYFRRMIDQMPDV